MPRRWVQRVVVVDGAPRREALGDVVLHDGVEVAHLRTTRVDDLEHLTGEPYATEFDYFTDDEQDAVHEPQINVVAEEGIAVGDGADRYSPAAPVRRDQMAGFLVRALATLEADGTIRPLP